MHGILVDHRKKDGDATRTTKFRLGTGTKKCSTSHKLPVDASVSVLDDVQVCFSYNEYEACFFYLIVLEELVISPFTAIIGQITFLFLSDCRLRSFFDPKTLKFGFENFYAWGTPQGFWKMFFSLT